jgi:small conductance mechanosensitive channel
MFILVEGQYAVGDVVNVAGVGGQVIEITPRRTVLRDQNGHVHIVPNSAITVATNMTQGFSRINLNVSVAYEEDIERVTQVINDECEKLAADFPMDIILAPKVLRVDALGADGIDIKILGDVKVFRQWDLMGELRRRLKARFDDEGIEIPYRREVLVPYGGGAAGMAKVAPREEPGDAPPDPDET